MSVGLFTKYCVDTSAIIDANGRAFPPATFPDLKPRFNQGFADGLLVSPREVRRELQGGSSGDELAEWATEHPEYFVDPDDVQIRLMGEVVSSLPVYDPKNLRPVDADPWVIVLAQAHSLSVITSENFDSTKKIPHFCAQLGVAAFDLLGFFAEEGWSFTLGAHGQ